MPPSDLYIIFIVAMLAIMINAAFITELPDDFNINRFMRWCSFFVIFFGSVIILSFIAPTILR